jgi:hypothetical protein
MANEALPEVDPAKSYRVVLARSIQIVEGIWARPSDHDVIISGADVIRFGAAIESYEEV